MTLDMLIDDFTPCLVEIATGEIHPTEFAPATRDDIDNLEGWLFNWGYENFNKRTNIYKITIKGDNVIQGLVATEIMRGTVYVSLAESAPHNQVPNKKYEGVGGHLFAIAIKLSQHNGFGGHIHMDAKSMDLVKHYIDMLGAVFAPTNFHDYRMEVSEENAQKIVKIYTMEGDFNVND